MTSNWCKTESTARSRDLAGKTSPHQIQLVQHISSMASSSSSSPSSPIGSMMVTFIFFMQRVIQNNSKTSSGSIDPVLDESHGIFRGCWGGHHSIPESQIIADWPKCLKIKYNRPAMAVVVNDGQFVQDFQFNPETSDYHNRAT